MIWKTNTMCCLYKYQDKEITNYKQELNKLTTIYKDVNMGPSKGFFLKYLCYFLCCPYPTFLIFFKWQVKCCCSWLCCISFIHCGTFSCPAYTWNIQPHPPSPLEFKQPTINQSIKMFWLICLNNFHDFLLIFVNNCL